MLNGSPLGYENRASADPGHSSTSMKVVDLATFGELLPALLQRLPTDGAKTIIAARVPGERSTFPED